MDESEGSAQSGCNSRWIKSFRRESNTKRKPNGKSRLAIQRTYSSSLGGETADGCEEWTQGWKRSAESRSGSISRPCF